jgi:replicative DNA helicase
MTPPNDTNLEQSVLFAAIYKSELAETVLDRIRPDWMYSSENKLIFEAMRICYADTGQVDPRSVISILERQQHAGAIANVVGGMQFASSHSNIEYHLDALQDYAIRRAIILECTRIRDKAMETDADGYACIDELAHTVTSIQDSDVKIHSMPSSEVIKLFEATERGEPMRTGLEMLDQNIYAEAGRHAGQIEVTVAHPGHGKTRYAIYKTVALARKGYKTHWFQLEDYGYKTAKLLQAILGDQADNIVITDSMFEIEQIKREARISARDMQVNNIVVDYVQNLSADRKSRAEDVEYISRQLTRMAIDLGVQVHVLSQVTIQDAQRKKWNLEPRQADVRWSRQLQQDAHMMTGIFRPSRVDGLYDDQWAQDWTGANVPLNSIYLRQLKTRYGEGYHKRYHMVDTEYGPIDYETWERANAEKNNAWRNEQPKAPQLEPETPF